MDVGQLRFEHPREPWQEAVREAELVDTARRSQVAPRCGWRQWRWRRVTLEHRHPVPSLARRRAPDSPASAPPMMTMSDNLEPSCDVPSRLNTTAGARSWRTDEGVLESSRLHRDVRVVVRLSAYLHQPISTGRVALVTRASSGLGHRFAVTLTSASAGVRHCPHRPPGGAGCADQVPVASASRWPSTSPTPSRSPMSSLEPATPWAPSTSRQQRRHPRRPARHDAASSWSTPCSTPTCAGRSCCRPRSPNGPDRRRSARADRQHRLDGCVLGCNGMAAAVYGVAVRDPSDDRSAGGRVARFHINVNGIAPAFASEMMRHALADGRLHRAVPAQATGPARAAGLHAALPRGRRDSEVVTGTTIKVDDGQGSR